MRKAILISLGVLYLSSCKIVKGVRVSAAQRKIERIEAKHPELFNADTTYQIKIDTITIETPYYYLDTILAPSDTMTIENERIKTVIIKLPADTTYQVQTVVKTVKIPFERIDTVYQIRKQITTRTDTQKIYPYWLIALSIILFILLVIYYIRYINFSE